MREVLARARRRRRRRRALALDVYVHRLRAGDRRDGRGARRARRARVHGRRRRAVGAGAGGGARTGSASSASRSTPRATAPPTATRTSAPTARRSARSWSPRARTSRSPARSGPCCAESSGRVMRGHPGRRWAAARPSTDRGSPMPDGERPNILVIWGDDIGITNLSCYSDGLMGYRTPNIDRIADEGMRFTDSYGEQSCTAGRSSFITGQSVFRTGLSKVGMPAAPTGLRAEDPTIAELLKPLGYATGQFGKNHLGDRNEFLPTLHGFDEFFGNLYHLNAEEEPESPNYPPPEDFPHFRERFGPRGVLHSLGDGRGRRDRGAALGPRRQAADRGHRAADEEADGDDRRRGPRARPRLHRPPGRRGDAVLRLVQHDAHALPHPPEAGERRAGRALAVALPRHDDRPRQRRRRAARQARRARDRRQHDRRLLDRQRPAHEHVAGRRHDAVPQREELQLGGRVPRARDGPLARARSRRASSPTRSSSTTTGCRPSSPPPATPTSWRS